VFTLFVVSTAYGSTSGSCISVWVRFDCAPVLVVPWRGMLYLGIRHWVCPVLPRFCFFPVLRGMLHYVLLFAAVVSVLAAVFPASRRISGSNDAV
jgi:hypothetical protein